MELENPENTAVLRLALLGNWNSGAQETSCLLSVERMIKSLIPLNFFNIIFVPLLYIIHNLKLDSVSYKDLQSLIKKNYGITY
jgi:hypothetical protein